ncbi:hypothetical protein ACWGJB_16860 [Streptomyces sp. NPDC054813]
MRSHSTGAGGAARREYVHGGRRVTLFCQVHSSPSSQWTKEVTVAEAAGIVGAFVVTTLAGQPADRA